MRRSRQRGFTLFEVLAAMSLFAIVGLGLAQFGVVSMRRTAGNRTATGAVLLAQQEIEDLRSLDYVNVATRSSAATVAGESYAIASTVIDDTPADGMKQITVTVTWSTPLGSQSYVARTILTSVTSG